MASIVALARVKRIGANIVSAAAGIAVAAALDDFHFFPQNGAPAAGKAWFMLSVRRNR